jgi:hypothetical protein
MLFILLKFTIRKNRNFCKPFVNFKRINSMMMSRLSKILLSFCLCLVLFLGACSSSPSPYDQVQKDTTGFRAEKAVDKKATQGAEFNKFFPDKVRGYEVIPAQEKKGFAEYKVKKDGKTLAMLSVSDTASNPSAAAKFDNTTEKIGGYPAVQVGSTMTSILVNGRYQVKVLSRDPAFSAEDRALWLQKFDLSGLSRLEASLPSRQKVNLPLKQAPSLTPQPAT